MGNKVQFCPLPLRVLGDARVSGLEVRLLAAIAYHDRLSISRGKGAGCWAGNQKLALTCDCRLDSVSAAITNLVACGYVTREPHPINKRLRVYRVNYGDEARADAQESEPDTLADAQASAECAAPIVGQLPKDAAPILGQPESQAPEINRKSGVEYIPHKRKDILLKQVRNSAEAAPLRGVEGARTQARPNYGAFLATVERGLKSGQKLDARTEQIIRDLLLQCRTEAHENPIFHQANRILETWGGQSHEAQAVHAPTAHDHRREAAQARLRELRAAMSGPGSTASEGARTAPAAAVVDL